MTKRQDGFTLVELMITMVLFLMTMAAATAIFVPLLTSFKQQSTMAESNIEGIIGLEILRRDIELAGFGIPWSIPADVTTASYSEASNTTSGTIPAPDTYNDAPDVPRAIFADNDIAGLGGSDYLVIKSTAVATNDAARKWADVIGTAGGGRTTKVWGNPYDDFVGKERVVVLVPYRSENVQRLLVNNGDQYGAVMPDNPAALNSFPSAYSPGIANEVFLIYGVDADTDLLMPFNRADYYIRRNGTIPSRCAKGVISANDTGVLMKSVIEQATGDRGNGIPLLDCVADMQVAFGLYNDDGTFSTWSEALTNGALPTLSAAQIRQQVGEVRVYILGHEGQYDPAYEYPNATITVGEAGIGRDYDLTLIRNYKNYRWKVYTLAVKPKNLR